ncbi:MAG: YraN family protein [Alphaproteobacteria bacterium]|nr:YraN family protein [Alphaproteobacteria bacterium]MCB9928322.1 YraN family protein [Alphaproteobacteria bacterium]
MTAERQRRERLGRAAEAQAAGWLRAQGYTILAERLRTPSGEIDLIAFRPPVLALVEVKARASTGRGLYALSARQAARIAAAGEHFLADHPEHADSFVRLDLIVVTPGGPPQHFPDAWQQDGDDNGW